ncbi:hypothetical protein ACSNOI_13435 [Actinomadura kijaniata]|uniref:hypothetical protein n=1 Tax=Actinomadura kijaniata TaxID=46161 RepID=UPI003F1A96AB
MQVIGFTVPVRVIADIDRSLWRRKEWLLMFDVAHKVSHVIGGVMLPREGGCFHVG